MTADRRAHLKVVRLVALLAAAWLLVLVPGARTAEPGLWQETRFTTGCDPGPYHPPPWPDPIVTHPPPPDAPDSVTLSVDLAAPADRPLLGTGFNFEHALWSCPAFRDIFSSEILEPFQPAIARVDTGLLPAAPAELTAADLGPSVYTSMLASPVYADSWRFLRRLNRANVKVVLGIWGGPDQFTADGTRRGLLLPAHYADYVEYVVSLVDFLVRQQGVNVWAITIANEPDGGDGNQIPPAGLAWIAHQLAERLGEYGVRLYGPDTATAATTLQYLPGLLDDPLVAANLAFVGFHEYYANPNVQTVVDYVHDRAPNLPVVITEYTSFLFGDLDDGQDANDRVGITLDIVNTLLSHLRHGVDAALYWDAVDYVQPGHDAVTKWGVLRGPSRNFSRRTRYYGLAQVLPYLQPQSRLLASQQQGDNDVTTLAVRRADGRLAIIVVNQGSGDADLRLDLSGAEADSLDGLWVHRTSRAEKNERVDWLELTGGLGQVRLPGRSLTTLVSGDETA